MSDHTSGVLIALYKSGTYGELQITIEDEVFIHRLLGPKFDGTSKRLRARELDERDIREIRDFLNKASRNLKRKAVANA